MATSAHTRSARRELHELRVEEWADFALGAVVLALSVASTQAAPLLAWPLLLGGFFVMLRGVIAAVRRSELVERLLLDSKAYEIPEIQVRGEHLASLSHRRVLADSIRSALRGTRPYRPARVELAAVELSALADQLEDETLGLDPYYAVRCHRLLMDGTESPLLNENLQADGLLSTIRRIRGGFESRV